MIRIISLLLLCLACSNTPKATTQSSLKNEYEFKDKSGSYRFKRESGPIAKTKNLFAVKQTLYGQSRDGRNEVMERSVVVAKAGNIKGKLPIWRPEKSEYTVWFDGKEYSVQTQLDEKIKGLSLTLKSPDSKYSGVQQHRLPDLGGIYCYFSQIIECASAMGFIDKAIDNNGGVMNFYIVWEGYPFFQQQYVGLSEEVYTKATLTYDGENGGGTKRFSLSMDNQIIFYQLDSSHNIKAIFWPAQGLSVGDQGSLEE